MSAPGEGAYGMTQRTETKPETHWSQFEARLRTYVRRRVDPLWADDIVGDVMLRLVQHRKSLEAADNPTAWTFRVAANAIADHHRRRAAEFETLAQAKSEFDTDPDTASDEPDSAGAEIARCLLPFIEGLPARYRDALMLTEIQGLTQAAAAERLGLSHSGMKSRIQRGRVKLKQALLRCCAIEVDRRGGVIDYTVHGQRCSSGCDKPEPR